MVVSAQTSPSFSAGRPEVLFNGPYLLSGEGRNYDISPDGQHFLMIKMEGVAADPEAAAEIVVVQNWFEELKRLLPGN